MDALREVTDLGEFEEVFSEYGDHLRAKSLQSRIYVYNSTTFDHLCTIGDGRGSSSRTCPGGSAEGGERQPRRAGRRRARGARA